MPRKVTVDALKARLAHFNEQLEASEKRKADLEEKRQKVLQEIKEKERAARTHTLCGLGGLVLKYFGEGISPEEFQELLNRIFRMNGVQEMVDAEKQKRLSADIAQESAEHISVETLPLISEESEEHFIKNVLVEDNDSSTSNA